MERTRVVSLWISIITTLVSNVKTRPSISGYNPTIPNTSAYQNTSGYYDQSLQQGFVHQSMPVVNLTPPMPIYNVPGNYAAGAQSGMYITGTHPAGTSYPMGANPNMPYGMNQQPTFGVGGLPNIPVQQNFAGQVIPPQMNMTGQVIPPQMHMPAQFIQGQTPVPGPVMLGNVSTTQPYLSSAPPLQYQVPRPYP